MAAIFNPGALTNPALKGSVIDKIKNIYWIERCQVRMMPGMAEQTRSERLRYAINRHLSKTKLHVKRLEKAFIISGMLPQTVQCKAMTAIVEEYHLLLEETQPGMPAREAGLARILRSIENHQIAAYNELISLTNILGCFDVAELLRYNLQEEQDMVDTLAAIAEYNARYVMSLTS